MTTIRKYSEGKPYKVVAYLVSCFAGDETARQIRMAHKMSKEYGCKLVFFSTISDFYYNDVNDAGEKKVFDAISVERFDAIILMSESFKMDEDMKRMVDRAVQAGVPVLAVDKYMENCINLRYDYGDSFKQVVSHLVEIHGYRDVNFLSGIKGNPYSEEREKAYREVLEENGIPFEEDRIYYGGFWEEPTRITMEEMINSPRPMPRAIICANDAMALEAVRFLKAHDYRVPEDVAVSGFDGIVMEKYHRPRLTTSITNYDGMLSTIFEIITKEIPKSELDDTVKIYNKIQIGSSCGCSELYPIDLGMEMVNLKDNLYLVMRFHETMNQMVSNLGDMENWYSATSSIPYYIYLMEYKKMYINLNTDFYNFVTSVYYRKKKRDTEQIYTSDMLSVILDGEDKSMRVETLEFGEMIPDFSAHLDEEEALMLVPIHLKGEIVGYCVVQFEPEVFRFNMCSSFVISYRYLLESQRNKRKLLDVYIKDSLTGLFNRNGFYDVTPKRMYYESEKNLAVIAIDMDHLKMINDTYGHAEGDVALRQIAKIMLELTYEDEICARIGGDEFLIAVCGDEVENRAESIKQEMLMALKEYNEAAGKPYPLSASIGVYCDCIRGNSLDHFLKQADDLMYANKLHHRKEKGAI